MFSRKNFVFLFGALINLTVKVDAYFHLIWMTYPIQPGPFFRAAPNWGKPAKHFLFLRSFRTGQTSYCPFSSFCSSITTLWGKPSNLQTSWVYSYWPRVSSWKGVRWIQYTTHRNTIIFASNLSYIYLDASSYFIPGQHFLETFALLSPNDQDPTFMDDHNVPVLNQQTRLLLHLWWPYLTHTFNNALTVTLHISLKHLAAKIPSQLRNSFILSFLPTRLAA